MMHLQNNNIVNIINSPRSRADDDDDAVADATWKCNGKLTFGVAPDECIAILSHPVATEAPPVLTIVGHVLSFECPPVRLLLVVQAGCESILYRYFVWFSNYNRISCLVQVFCCTLTPQTIIIVITIVDNVVSIILSGCGSTLLQHCRYESISGDADGAVAPNRKPTEVNRTRPTWVKSDRASQTSLRKCKSNPL